MWNGQKVSGPMLYIQSLCTENQLQTDTNFFKRTTNVITFSSGAKFLKMENNKKYQHKCPVYVTEYCFRDFSNTAIPWIHINTETVDISYCKNLHRLLFYISNFSQRHFFLSFCFQWQMMTFRPLLPVQWNKLGRKKVFADFSTSSIPSPFRLLVQWRMVC